MNLKGFDEFIKKQITNVVFTFCICTVLVVMRAMTLEDDPYYFWCEATYAFVLALVGIRVKIEEYLDLD